jgi:hypothetical protein
VLFLTFDSRDLDSMFRRRLTFDLKRRFDGVTVLATKRFCTAVDVVPVHGHRRMLSPQL